ncbi:MAG: hypothetical protein AABX02_03025 [archaeon]
MTKTNNGGSSATKWIIPILILLGIGIIGYSLFVTFNSGASTEGIVTCPTPDTCFWSSHFHIYAPIEICGEEFPLPVELGSLQKSHTHEEKNIIHWHDKLPYDNVAKKIIDTTDLTLGSFYDQVNIPFSSTQLDGKTNGDTCSDGTVGTWKMLVNGKPNTEYRKYEMHDRDVIWTVFDSRTMDEVTQAWSQTPIRFPTLGNG